MNYPNELHQRIMQLEEFIRQLQEKTNSLESMITTLQNEITQLKSSPNTSIEYKFDQLKIETLEGTLNIGLTPGGNGFENIEDLGVNGGNFQVNQQKSPTTPFTDEMYQWMNQGVDHYLNYDVFKDIQKVEQKSAYTLPESQRKLIIDDIKKQMSQRLPHYMMATKRDKAEKNPNQEVDRIMTQIKKDILTGIEIYINNEKKKSQGGHKDGT
ncbi:spore germination protein GerPC [Pseudalkalibacillus berkeleyi]|uniref:Spore germination protein GerPC n=1 Tax=Pseudalkalibacillus berkeleyi TaxID=1069813 RepID=A0ABS9GX69_9BACL|nr:spore germination protein GerPC [Pseudalkalibacillus berkeleyi]MCF6137374.1 spore germination protein GerPC [Pseudalkalibacillus berkeleyi]